MLKTNIKFNLNNPQAKRTTAIYLIYRYTGKRFRYATQLTINPNDWDMKRQRANPTFEYHSLNDELNRLEAAISDVIRDLNYKNEIPTFYQLKKAIDDKLNRSEKALGFLGFVEKMIEQSATVKDSKTIAVYRTSINHLKDFGKYRKTALEFGNFDLDFCLDYINYLLNVKGFSHNSAKKYIIRFKLFLNKATEAGLYRGIAYKNRRFNVPDVATTKIYLTETELNQILHFDFSDNERLAKVRDVFYVASYTGLRYSDIAKLSKEHIQNGNISLYNEKGKTKAGKVVIPLRPEVAKLIEKYDYKLPVISNQKTNDYIKQVCKMVGIEEAIPIKKSSNGKIYEVMSPKYKEVTVHTARRSFATNAFLNDIPSIAIMKITGHQTEKAFLSYICISAEENANKMMQHPFFTNAKMKVV